MAAWKASFVSLLRVLKGGLQETQENPAAGSPSGQQLRRDKRYQLKGVRAELRRPLVPPLPCCLQNLSEDGCRLVVEPEEELNLGAWKAELSRSRTLDIAIQTTPREEVKVLAQVRPLSGDISGGMILGAQFCALSETQRQDLAAVIKLSLGQQRASKSMAAMSALSEGEAKPLSDPANLRALCRGRELGAVLVLMEALSEQELNNAMREAARRGQQLDSFLLEQRLVTDVELCLALSLQTGIPVHSLVGITVSVQLLRLFSRLTLLRLKVVPLEIRGTVISIAAARPLKQEATTELEKQCNSPLLVYLAPEDRILELLNAPEGRRAKERATAVLTTAQPVTYAFCTSEGTLLVDKVCSGTALEISEKGFKLEGPAADWTTPEELLERGAMVQVIFCEQAKPVNALCRLRNAARAEQPLGGQPGWVLGLRVVKVAEEDLCALRAPCSSTSVRPACGQKDKSPG